MNALATIPNDQEDSVLGNPHVESLAKIEQVEKRLLQLPQIETKLTHRFAPGVYMRELFMPAHPIINGERCSASIVIGHEHTTAHFNVILSGRATVIMEGRRYELNAGDVVFSQAGVRKILYIHEDMRWATIHPTDETDVEKLEAMLIIKSDSWLAHDAEIKQLQDAVKKEE